MSVGPPQACSWSPSGRLRRTPSRLKPARRGGAVTHPPRLRARVQGSRGGSGRGARLRTRVGERQCLTQKPLGELFRERKCPDACPRSAQLGGYYQPRVTGRGRLGSDRALEEV